MWHTPDRVRRANQQGGDGGRRSTTATDLDLRIESGLFVSASAFFRGYEVAVPADGVDAFSEEASEDSLKSPRSATGWRSPTRGPSLRSGRAATERSRRSLVQSFPAARACSDRFWPCSDVVIDNPEDGALEVVAFASEGHTHR